MNYLEICFDHAQKSDQASAWDSENLSYYTYSHRVVGEGVNSSRLAYGSLVDPQALVPAARVVLNERNIEIDSYYFEHPSCYFGGLGWDLATDDFKIYFRITDLRTVVPPLTELTLPQQDIRPGGLASLTFRRGQLFESKLYVYPTQLDALPMGVKHRALMCTSLRGVVDQDDVDGNADWLTRVNATGQRIIQQYRGINASLDTVAYNDPDHFTLYFQ